MESEPPGEYQQVSLEVIKATIRNPPSQETVHRFICDEVEFLRLRTLLEQNRTVGLYFNATLKHLRFTTAVTPIHEAPVDWFNDWLGQLRNFPGLGQAKRSTFLIKGLRRQFNSINKMPDAAWNLQSPGMPTIVMEVGYSETLDQLKVDAKNLLEGSNGAIQLVLIVGIQPLQRGDTSIQKATIQVWEYDLNEKKAAYKGYRQVIPPPTKHPETQNLIIPWSIILRPTQTQPTIAPLPLNLHVLRSEIAEATEEHLWMNRNQEEAEAEIARMHQ